MDLDFGDPHLRRHEMNTFKDNVRPLTKAVALTAQEEAALARKAKAGDKAAINQLMMANMKLVNAMVRKYDQGLPSQDLMQEGSIGLMNAISHFDPNRGIRFSTYAAWWIREAINRSISNKSRVVRLPVHLNELMTKIRRIKSELTLKLGKQPTVDQIAAEIGVKPDKVRAALEYSKPCLSLDQPASNDDEDKLTIGDTIVDDEAAEPVSNLETEYLKERINAILSQLSEKEQKVIKMRFGIGSNEELSLNEISGELGLTRDQVGKISYLAMRKLKNMVPKEEFGAFLA